MHFYQRVYGGEKKHIFFVENNFLLQFFKWETKILIVFNFKSKKACSRVLLCDKFPIFVKIILNKQLFRAL